MSAADLWHAPHPPRWYAREILRLLRRRHGVAMQRVPEHLRPMVAQHVQHALDRGALAAPADAVDGA